MDDKKYLIAAELLKTPRPTVLSGDALSAAALLEKSQKPLWYLAYGSNLNLSVFKGRRRIKPLQERHVLVEGLELTFDLPGLPYLEPRFANCRFATPSVSNDASVFGNDEKAERGNDIDLNAPWTGKGALIGVAYLVSAADFARVIKTEDGGSGYKMVSVQGEVFHGKAKPGSKEEERFEFTGEVVHAFTLFAPGERVRKPFGQPSTRYLTLIREGAKEHKLPPSYCAYLSSLTPYSTPHFRQKLGAAVSITLFGPPFLAIVLLGLLFADKDGNYPHWVSEARAKFTRLAWRVYENHMTRLFGEGESTMGAGV